MTSDYGRINNIVDSQIHVASALSLTDCVRQCVDFRRRFNEYNDDECFAYNFQIDDFTCELIHSTNRLNYNVDVQSRWITGFN